jgi:hypothetical protein
METRSKSSNPREKRIVLPSEPTSEEYSFPPANQWGREELRRLGVTFHTHPNKRFSKLGHLTHWELKFSDTLQERITLVRNL